MKSLLQILFLASLSVLLTSLVFAQHVPDPNTVALWHFDELTGDSVHDASANANDGIATGTTIVDGRFGKARSFNGSTDYITINNESNFDFTTSSFTLEAWINPASLDQNQYIISKYNSYLNDSAGYFFVLGSSSGTYSLYFGINETPTSAYTVGVTTPLSVLGQWHHLAAIVDFVAKNVNLYMDGAQLKVETSGTFPDSTVNFSEPVKIGANTDHYGNITGNFQGMIDEVRISNKARTPKEFDIPVDLNAGLVAYYPFNGNANDESGNGNNGIDSGATLTTDRFGNANSAYSFDGNGSFIDIPNSESMNFTVGGFSLVAWIQLAGSQSDRPIVGKHIPGSLNGYLLGVTDQGLQFYLGSYTPAAYTTSLGNSWHFIVGSYDGNTASLYVDGLLVSQEAIVYTNVNSTTIKIASYNVAGFPLYFQGKIDDIRIYDRALADAEVQKLYHENGWGIIHARIDQFSLHAGDTVSASVNMTFPEGKTYSSAELSFGNFQNNGLSFLGIDTASSLMNNKGWQIQLNGTDTSLITASAGAQDISGSGVLFNLKFAVTGNPCTFVPITITKAVFNTGTDSVSVTNGGVNIKAIPSYGDVDQNGLVQAYDASLILKHVFDDSLSCQALANAKVNCNDTLMAYDATLILQNVVGLITLPYCNVIQATGDLSMPEVLAVGSKPFTIPVTLSNGDKILSFEGLVDYDTSALRFDGIDWASSLDSFSKEARAEKGKIIMAGASATENGHAGAFASLRFTSRIPIGQTTVSLKRLRWNANKIVENISSGVVKITVGVPIAKNEMPTEYALAQNYPNPFNPTTKVSYAIPGRSQVKLEIYNTLGQMVATLVNGVQEAGYYDIPWQVPQHGISSGLYFYRLQAVDVSNPSKNFVQVRKMVLLK